MIAPEERHGKPSSLFPFWLGSNIIITYMLIGGILIVLGLPLAAAIAIAVLGNLTWVFRSQSASSVVTRAEAAGHITSPVSQIRHRQSAGRAYRGDGLDELQQLVGIPELVDQPGGLGPAYCGNSLSLVGNYRVKLERSLAALVKTVHPSSRTGGGAGL